MPLLVLGAGYVGRALVARFPGAVGTKRNPPGQSSDVKFSLEDESSWTALPVEGRDVVWTFPAAPLPNVQKFFDAKLGPARSLVVLGSTSAYVPSADGVVTETSPLDLSQPRVEGEEWLRAKGATVLRLAGIFGPGREPCSWVEKGRIQNGLKTVNLIHLDDIVAAVDALTKAPRPGETINASSGRAIEWREIVGRCRQKGLLPSWWKNLAEHPAPENKRVDNARLRALLPDRFFQEP